MYLCILERGLRRSFLRGVQSDCLLSRSRLVAMDPLLRESQEPKTNQSSPANKLRGNIVFFGFVFLPFAFIRRSFSTHLPTTKWMTMVAIYRKDVRKIVVFT